MYPSGILKESSTNTRVPFEGRKDEVQKVISSRFNEGSTTFQLITLQIFSLNTVIYNEQTFREECSLNKKRLVYKILLKIYDLSMREYPAVDISNILWWMNNSDSVKSIMDRIRSWNTGEKKAKEYIGALIQSPIS